MNKTIILREDTQLPLVNALCKQVVYSGTPHDIIIKEHKVKLSVQQRHLYFHWIGIICNEFGNSKEEQHLEMKKRFLIPIFIREHEGFAEMVDAVQKVKDSDPGTWRTLADYILQKTSIMDANVAEMREYMTEVDQFAASNSIRLPLPEDRELDKRVWKR